MLITGNHFQPSVVASLGNEPITIVSSTQNTIEGIAPHTLPAGTYTLVVTNPDGRSGRLTAAFTVVEPAPPVNQQGLEYSRLVTFGRNDLGLAAREDVQRIFFDMPTSTTGSIYIHLYDPDTFRGPVGAGDEIERGEASVTRFSVYGGEGAYSSPAARAAPPLPNINSGVQLNSHEFGPGDVQYNNNWSFHFGPFDVSQGELVNGRYVFRLDVEGVSGDDGNIYDVALSSDPDRSQPVAGSRIFAFSWSFVIFQDDDSAERPNLYPYVGSQVTTFRQYNCGFFDMLDNAGGTIRVRTLEQDLLVPENAISHGADCRNSAFHRNSDFSAEEVGGNWSVDFKALTFSPLVPRNSVIFWTIDQNGVALALFTRAGLNLPP